MSKPKLIKSNSAKAMHELASKFILPGAYLSAIHKDIELRAIQGSYFMNSPSGTFELISQLRDALEDDGFKCEIKTPDVGDEDNEYWLKITW